MDEEYNEGEREAVKRERNYLELTKQTILLLSFYNLG